jgi:short-subunit dehydrogenase
LTKYVIGLYAATKHSLEALSESLDHEVRGFGIRVVLIKPSVTNTRFDSNWARAKQQIESYAIGLNRAATALVARIKSAAGPDIVAAEIMRAIEQPYRMRRPVGFEASLLSRLRRFMPAGPVDRSIRKWFGLN